VCLRGPAEAMSFKVGAGEPECGPRGASAAPAGRELEIVYAECGERRLVLIDASVAFAEGLPVRGFPC
jgi:hypothetical protein